MHIFIVFCLYIFSFDKEENVRLEEEIKLHHLEQLMHRFQIHRPDDILIQPGTGFFPPKTQPRTPGRMNLAEFKETVSEVLMTDEYDEYLEKLFLKVGHEFHCWGTLYIFISLNLPIYVYILQIL